FRDHKEGAHSSCHWSEILLPCNPSPTVDNERYETRRNTCSQKTKGLMRKFHCKPVSWQRSLVHDFVRKPNLSSGIDDFERQLNALLFDSQKSCHAELNLMSSDINNPPSSNALYPRRYSANI